MVDAFRAGMRVRLKSNPGRIGTLSGETIEHRGSVRWEVHFDDETEFVPALSLEAVTTSSSNPYSLIRDMRFLRVRALRSALTYHRLSGRLADMIYSLDTTNTDFLAYQFKPVLGFLDSPSRGILIADEVGLGKTIEAGLIWTELRSREEAKRLLVLCPAILREKWKRELRSRFSVNAEICSASEVLQRLREAVHTPDVDFALIASLQGLRPGTGWDDDEDAIVNLDGAAGLARFLRERADEDPLLDLVVIDEAHYLRNAETQTARLGRLIRSVANGLVLLSATPIQLRNTDLFNLLNLLDRDTFPFEWSFDALLQQTGPLVELRDCLIRGPLPASDFKIALTAAMRAQELGVSELLSRLAADPPSDDELRDQACRVRLADTLDRANPVSKVLSRTRKRDVQESRTVRAPVALRAQMTAVEERFYTAVTDAVREYCADREVVEGFMLTIPQRQMCSSMAAACRVWRERVNALDAEIEEIIWEAFGDQSGERPKTIQPLISELARISRENGDFNELKVHDSKFNVLKEQLLEYWRRFPESKVVLFAYFRGTLAYLQERFAELGVQSCLLMGGMDKETLLRQFEAPEGPRLLLSSEVASEGVDLQFSSLVINYDLPWNPMRIEQRIGRIDRIGQKAPRILIWNLFLSDTLDDRVYSRLFERLRIFERALGVSEGILGDQVRSMSYELLTHRLSPKEEEEVIEQTRMAMHQNAQLQEQLENEAARLVAHGDYLQLKINAARQLNRYVGAQDLLVYVRDFLQKNYEGSQFVPEREEALLYEIDLGPDARVDFGFFLEQQRMQGKSRLAAPGNGRQRCRFLNRLGTPTTRNQTISQYHPLVAWVSRQMRASEAARHAPIAALRLDCAHATEVVPGGYLFSVQRWLWTGERVVERLVFDVRRIGGEEAVFQPDEAERLVTTAALHGADWIEARADLDGRVLGDLFADSVAGLDARFAEFTENAEIENRDRINLQLQLIDRHEANGVEDLRSLIARLRAEGKHRTIRANEGRIKKVRERADDRRAKLRARLKTTHVSRLAAGGVILVE